MVVLAILGGAAFFSVSLILYKDLFIFPAAVLSTSPLSGWLDALSEAAGNEAGARGCCCREGATAGETHAGYLDARYHRFYMANLIRLLADNGLNDGVCVCAGGRAETGPFGILSRLQMGRLLPAAAHQPTARIIYSTRRYTISFISAPIQIAGRTLDLPPSHR